MKKSLSLFALLCVVAAFACTGALAVGGSISNVKAEKDGVELKPEGEGVDGVYKNADKLQITYSKAEEGRQYLILLLSAAPEISEERILPTKNTIFYMDQSDDTQIKDGKVSFLAYPRDMSSGQYYIYMSASAAAQGASNAQDDALSKLTQVGSFQYAAQKRYYGDVDGNGEPTINEIMTLIIAMVDNKMTPEYLELSDVDGNGEPTINEFMQIIIGMVNGASLPMPS